MGIGAALFIFLVCCLFSLWRRHARQHEQQLALQLDMHMLAAKKAEETGMLAPRRTRGKDMRGAKKALSQLGLSCESSETAPPVTVMPVPPPLLADNRLHDLADDEDLQTDYRPELSLKTYRV